MFENETVFFVLSLAATYFGFKNLEHSRKSPSLATMSFLAILGLVAAYKYRHFSTGELHFIAWLGFLFLGISPLLTLIIRCLLEAIGRVVLFVGLWIICCVLSFFLLGLPMGYLLFVGAFVVVLAYHLPQTKLWQWVGRLIQRHRLRKQEHRQQVQQERLEQEEKQQQATEKALFEQLVRDLGK